MIIVHMVHVDHVGIFVDFQFCKKVINSPKIHSFQFPTSPLVRKTPLRLRRQGAVETSVGAKRVLHEALLKKRHAASFVLYQFCRLEISQSWLVNANPCNLRTFFKGSIPVQVFLLAIQRSAMSNQLIQY